MEVNAPPLVARLDRVLLAQRAPLLVALGQVLMELALAMPQSMMDMMLMTMRRRRMCPKDSSTIGMRTTQRSETYPCTGR